MLEAGGLKVGRDIFLAFSPEREDPGNPDFGVHDIPKVVGADDDASRVLAEAYYSFVGARVVPVSSAATAEAVKLTENIFRCVNIALVNELKHIFAEMDVDVWEVIDAAKTKPFGFMPFYPGPGLGGHCIPIDPFYLSWKAREYDIPARFIELAGEINSSEPRKVVESVARALSSRKQKCLSGAKILIMGIAYKKNVDDMRESPALHIMRHLEEEGAEVTFYDPWIATIPKTREYPQLAGRQRVDWAPKTLAQQHDMALILTDHSDVDYAALVEAFDLTVDTRNATKHIQNRLQRVVLA
jgi:UDP-N-acetyl-D-glucosamine dehydrogenase